MFKSHGSLYVIEALESRTLLSATIADDPNHVLFDRTVIEPKIVVNGHKPKGLTDIDGDGFTDVVAMTVGDGLYWYKYPTWTKYKIWNGGDATYEDAQTVDVDNDGDNDVILADRWFENPLAQGGDPTKLWAMHMINNTTARHDVEIGDINLDGKIDVAELDGIYLQNSSASWTVLPKSLFPGRGAQGTALGDVDNDGDLDLLTPTATAPYQLVWYENPTIGGKGPITSTWTKHVIAPAYPLVSALVIDIDEDGRNDVVLAPEENSSGPIVWLKAPANPRASNATWVSTTIEPLADSVHSNSIKPADYNGDGHIDLFVVEQEQSAQERLMIFYGDGTGQNFVRQIFPPPLGGHNPKIGDVDNDGDVDILNANHGFFNAPNPVDLWRNETNPINMPVISVAATDRNASETNRDPGVFTFTRSIVTNAPLTVRYAIKGLSTDASDYDALPGFVVIPAGQSSANVVIRPIDDSNAEGLEAVSVTLLPDPTYSITTAAIVSQTPVVLIADNDTFPSTSGYLSDMSPTYSSNGWGSYERDMSNGEQAAGDGRTITLNGVTYSKGLGVHAASELRYLLSGNYKRFTASVGVDDEEGNNGSVIFQVWADGSMLYQSPTMTGASATQNVNLDISGKNELRLVVTDAGNGNSFDHADWAGALVTAGPAVLGSTFDVVSGPPSLRIAFNTDISQLPNVSQNAISVSNLTTGATIPGSAMKLTYDSESRIATLSFPGLTGGRLPDGDYRVTIHAADVADASGNTLTGDYSTTFFYLNGDANHDRAVNINDLYILSTNWQKKKMNFLQGDFNNDGIVDIRDLQILSANWNKSF